MKMLTLENLELYSSIIVNPIAQLLLYRMWYGDGKKACWETMIKALLRMGEKTSAEKLKEKYKVRVPSLQNTQPNKQA